MFRYRKMKSNRVSIMTTPEDEIFDVENNKSSNDNFKNNSKKSKSKD